MSVHSHSLVRIEFDIFIVTIVTLVILIVSSIHVWKVRKTHMDAIQKRNAYFGILEEEFNILKSMKSGIHEIIKLNFITSVLVMVGAVSRILDLLCVPGIPKIFFRLPAVVYNVTNPFVYMLIMKDLKEHYLRLLPWRSRRVSQSGDNE